MAVKLTKRCRHMLDRGFQCVRAAGHDRPSEPERDRGHKASEEFYLGDWPPFERMTVEWRSDVAYLLIVQLAIAMRNAAEVTARHAAELAELRSLAGQAGRAWDAVNQAHRAGRRTVRIADILGDDAA